MPIFAVAGAVSVFGSWSDISFSSESKVPGFRLITFKPGTLSELVVSGFATDEHRLTQIFA
jgi:hypothetical protein